MKKRYTIIEFGASNNIRTDSVSFGNRDACEDLVEAFKSLDRVRGDECVYVIVESEQEE